MSVAAELTGKQGQGQVELCTNRRRAFTRPAGLNGQLDDALFGDVRADFTVKHEKVWHREAQELFLQGLTQIEIAHALDKSFQQVSSVLKQPWARQRMIERTKQSTVDQIKEVLERESLPSIEVLVEIRDDQNARKADRKSAADSLLDRFLGKPSQPISHSGPEIDVSKLTNKEILERLAANGVLSPAANAETEPPK